MRYVAAYMLASLGGNDNPALGDLKKILGSVGIDCEDDKAEKVISSLKGKNIDEVIAAGSQKLASVPSGGGGAPAAGGGAPAAGGGDKPAEAAAEEKKKEDSESEDEDMGFGLFD